MTRDFLIAHRDAVSVTFCAFVALAVVVIAWCSGADYGYRRARRAELERVNKE
jgi:hypothetical protein